MGKNSPTTVHDSLKWFASNRPPFLILSVVLGLIALILMTFAFCVQYSKFHKPDVSQDWNLFLESFTKLEFCVDNVTSSSTVAPPSSVSPPPLYDINGTEHTPVLVPYGQLKNYSVSMLLEVKPTLDFISIPHNLTYLTGFILGSELGLKGDLERERISITMQLPFEWNNTRCASSFFSEGCDTVRIYTCVYLQAPEFVFPAARSPPKCEILNDTGVEYHAVLKSNKPSLYSKPSFYSTHGCRGKTVIRTQYKLDSRLTILISLSDRSLINLHLLHSSYFVFVMTITILLYIVIRGLPIRLKSFHAAASLNVLMDQ